jgi:hypothetical protein
MRAHIAGMRGFILTVTLALSLSPSLAQARFYRGPYEAPPPPRSEVIRERHGYVWVGGHYGWRHNHYLWSHGHYARERPGWGWREGAWEHRDRDYVWRPGRWEQR